MTIVVGVVPTPEGHAALGHALEVAGRTKEKLVAVNSYADTREKDVTISMEVNADALRERMTESGLDFEVRQLGYNDDAGSAILAVAEEVSATLIVIGLRRRTPIGKLVLGSTSQRVLLEAGCPVLAVKA